MVKTRRCPAVTAVFFLLILISLIITICFCGCGVTELTAKNYSEKAETENIEILPEGGAYDPVRTFSYELFLQNMDGQNPVLSPVSAYLALSMAGDGSDTATKAEFQELLGDQAMAVSEELMASLHRSSENCTIALANSAWIDKQFLVNEDWTGRIQAFMDAQAFQSDLAAPETMNSMNKWVKKHTNGLIDKMVEKPLDKNIKMVLFNTIYFKAKWSLVFSAEMTRAEDFTLEDSKAVSAQMMRKCTDMDYLSNDLLEGVVFPYRNDEEKDSSLALVALRPKHASQKIREACSGLTSQVIDELLADRQTKLVNLKLPKFEITFDKRLNESLQKMGLTEAFDVETADFSLLGTTKNGENLYLSLVRQKAKIIVDEEGTEAAAVTEVALSGGGAPDMAMPVDVFFDRPFLYIIMDMDNKIPLFIGILDNPAV